MRFGTTAEAVAWVRAKVADGPKEGAQDALEGEGPVKAKEWVYEAMPEFKPCREVLPREARWAKVIKVGMNRYLREIRFEDNGEVEKLWVTARQVERKMAEMGKVVAVTWNEDEMQGGWKMWVKR